MRKSKLTVLVPLLGILVAVGIILVVTLSLPQEAESNNISIDSEITRVNDIKTWEEFDSELNKVSAVISEDSSQKHTSPERRSHDKTNKICSNNNLIYIVDKLIDICSKLCLKSKNCNSCLKCSNCTEGISKCTTRVLDILGARKLKTCASTCNISTCSLGNCIKDCCEADTPAPVSTPIAEPVSVPVSTPITEPVSVPVSTPITEPVSVPVSPLVNCAFNLSSATEYGLYSNSNVTTLNTTIVNGSIGVRSLTGSILGPFVVSGFTTYGNTVVATDINRVYQQVNALPCTTTSLTGTLLDGILTPGVHCFTVTGANLNVELVNELVFDALGNPDAFFVIRGTSLNQLSVIIRQGARMTLVNGANAANIFVSSGNLHVGANTQISGTYFSFAGIALTITSPMTLNGRILPFAVTQPLNIVGNGTSVITVPACQDVFSPVSAPVFAPVAAPITTCLANITLCSSYLDCPISAPFCNLLLGGKCQALRGGSCADISGCIPTSGGSCDTKTCSCIGGNRGACEVTADEISLASRAIQCIRNSSATSCSQAVKRCTNVLIDPVQSSIRAQSVYESIVACASNGSLANTCSIENCIYNSCEGTACPLVELQSCDSDMDCNAFYPFCDLTRGVCRGAGGATCGGNRLTTSNCMVDGGCNTEICKCYNNTRVCNDLGSKFKLRFDMQTCFRNTTGSCSQRSQNCSSESYYGLNAGTSALIINSIDRCIASAQLPDCNIAGCIDNACSGSTTPISSCSGDSSCQCGYCCNRLGCFECTTSCTSDERCGTGGYCAENNRCTSDRECRLGGTKRPTGK
jgi:hypothetical protein